MEYLRVKNWSEFQHYKDRNPPWIKLHRELLDDYEFERLQDASKAHLILIWLFASQREGRIPNDPAFLKKKLGLKSDPNLKSFIDQGFLIVEQDASTPLAEREQVAPRGEDIKQQSRGEPAKLNGKHRLETSAPEAFEITEPMWSWAQEQGVPHARVEPETAKFLDHHKAKGSRFKDWDAAWRTWMRNSVEFAQARKH
ncbi:MAG TPA: hypothetical protein VF516_03315 [Kofleriaceae bacterium]